MTKVAGYGTTNKIIAEALKAGGGDVEKALAIARKWVIVGGPEGISEQKFEDAIAKPLRAARRMQ